MDREREQEQSGCFLAPFTRFIIGLTLVGTLFICLLAYAVDYSVNRKYYPADANFFTAPFPEKTRKAIKDFFTFEDVENVSASDSTATSSSADAASSDAAPAKSAFNDKAITMAAYTKDWCSYISLRNNLNVDVSSYSFRVIFYNMDDVAIDYQDFDVDVPIAAGMTKTIKLSDYGEKNLCSSNGDYIYYADKPKYSSRYYYEGKTKYKVGIQLKSYKVKK